MSQNLTNGIDEFYQYVEEHLEIPKDKAREILIREGHTTWNPKMRSTLLNVLWKHKEGNLESGIKERILKQATESYGPCPICGSPTYFKIQNIGKYTKKPGWTCSKFGDDHFNQEKANEICEQLGQKLPFPRFVAITSGSDAEPIGVEDGDNDNS